MLARRAYSVAELRQALEKKFPGSTGVSDALHRLRQLRYLDDKKFAEQHAASLARNRAFGRFRIRRELKAKLVDYRHIEPAIRQTFEEIDERDLLARTLEKKLRAFRPPITPGKLHSLCQSLIRHGFPTDDIMKAMRARPELRPVAEQVDPTELATDETEKADGE